MAGALSRRPLQTSDFRLPTLTIVVPFHRDGAMLARCLDALAVRPRSADLIVVADGATDDCRAVAVDRGARVVAIAERSGPAVARNAAAAEAAGEVLVFVDADVAIAGGALERLTQLFADRPRMSAVFGAYDDSPADPGFASQYKNLTHAFVHRESAGPSRTFWAGFGAVRRDAFVAVGGFDERFTRPSVEDIDLGYRLSAAGCDVTLDPSLQACHLKRWTLASMFASDVRDRGIPWTQLALRYGALRGGLNLQPKYRWSIVLAYVGAGAAILALRDRRFAIVTAASAVALAALGWRLYAFLARRRGLWFAVRAFPVHVLHHLANGVSFAIGAALFVGARTFGLRTRATLAVHPWQEGQEGQVGQVGRQVGQVGRGRVARGR